MEKQEILNPEVSKKAFVHCGMPKTGTSSIQKALDLYREQLQIEGIKYPNTPLDNHAALISLYDSDGIRNGFFKHNSKVNPKSAAEQLNEEISRGNQTLVLSCEYLIHCRGNFDNLTRDLRDFGYDTTFIFYLRHPVNSAISSAQQSIKTGDRTIDEVSEEPRWHNFVLPIRDAQKCSRSVLVFDYNKIEDVVEHFFRTISSHINPKIKKVNQGISMTGALMADQWRKMKAVGANVKFSMKDALAQKGEPFTLPYSAIEKIRDEGKDAVEFIKNEFEIDLKEIKINSRFRGSL